MAKVALELLLRFDFEVFAFAIDKLKAVIGRGKRVIIGIGGVGVDSKKIACEL